jgi:hypothetical protein
MATSLTVPISNFTVTDSVGVTGYLVNQSSATPSVSASGWSSTAPTSFTFSASGSQTAYAWAKDAAGKVSAGISAGTVITLPNITPPTVTSFTLPTTATSLTVPISSFTATDSVGVTGYLVNQSSATPSVSASGWSSTAPTSFTFSASGSQTAYAWAKDAAGNVSANVAASTVITLPNTTPPTVTAFTLPATATSLTVPISSFTATDSVGVTGYLVNQSSAAPTAGASGWSGTAPTSFTFSAFGSQTAYAWAKDAAGNVSACVSASTVITPITVITTPSSPAGAVHPVDYGASGWTIDTAASDGDQGHTGGNPLMLTYIDSGVNYGAQAQITKTLVLVAGTTIQFGGTVFGGDWTGTIQLLINGTQVATSGDVPVDQLAVNNYTVTASGSAVVTIICTSDDGNGGGSSASITSISVPHN